eukprot:tig00021254_g19698.t1
MAYPPRTGIKLDEWYNASGTSGGCGAASPVYARGARTAARAFRSRSVLVGQAARKAPTLGASASPAARAGDDSLAAFLNVAGAPRAAGPRRQPRARRLAGPGAPQRGPGARLGRGLAPDPAAAVEREIAPLSPPFAVPASPPSNSQAPWPPPRSPPLHPAPAPSTSVFEWFNGILRIPY